MDKKLLFVYNPRSGRALIRNKLADILDIFAGAGYEITIVPTRGHDNARKVIAGRWAGYDLVVCSGGDGTLDEIVTGMIQSGFCTPIGYIPAGSTNDFGKSLSIPKNMRQAAEPLPATTGGLMRMYSYTLRLSDCLRTYLTKRGRRSRMCWGIWHICWKA